MKKQIKDLTLWEIDYLVAKAEGFEPVTRLIGKNCLTYSIEDGWEEYSPTTNPSQAWPIIERERISTSPLTNTTWIAEKLGVDFDDKKLLGKTPLEAAMRCRLASVYGDEVEL